MSPNGKYVKRLRSRSKSRSARKSTENSYKKVKQSDELDEIVQHMKHGDWENQDSLLQQSGVSKNKKQSHDGHRISMQDCDPSPGKRMQEKRSDLNSESYYPYEDQYQGTQPTGFIDLGFANDNSSVMFTKMKNLDSKKLSAT